MTNRINARAFAEIEREAELRRRAAERREALRSAEGSGRRAPVGPGIADAPSAVLVALEPAREVAPEPARELAHAGC
ncbi:hypothetical protein [Leifsonia sp. AG29]|uniref:hypothetical protein n=1 Tax=Leifsonia sp. AG29 TaxID=2598860 RepID=UPI00131BC487|nr:hypothetical protein [Leifsonia sp. AG29]